MKYKIILDRSIFHGDNFEKVRNSSLSDLLKKEKLRVYFTTVFWEETLKYIQASRSELEIQLKFLFSIDTNKWFRRIEDIIELELNNQWDLHKYYLFSKAEIKGKKQDFLDISSGKLSIAKALDENKMVEKNKLNRVEWLKKVRETLPKVNKDFDSFFKNEESVVFDRVLLPRHPNTKQNWLDNKCKCRLTNQYMKAFTTLIYFASSDYQLGIDRNDRSDAEQLSFMIFADLFVSNDTRYMKKAFNLLYGNSNKKLLSLDEFLEFIR